MNKTTKQQTLESISKVGTRIMLSALWISHFLLWSFGDMLALLQEKTQPISEDVFLVIAPSLAIIQVIMITYTLRGEAKIVRWLNLGVPLVFLIFNLGYLAENSEIWNYLLGAAYIMVNLMTIWNSWNWGGPVSLGDD